VRTRIPPADAFAFVANLAHLPQWDAGVSEASQVRGDGPGPDAIYSVTLSTRRPTTLRYETTAFDGDAPSTTLVASHSWYRSIDTISASPSGDGAYLTYSAELELLGPLKLADFLMRRVFNRIGKTAEAGLVRELDGEVISSSA